MIISVSVTSMVKITSANGSLMTSVAMSGLAIFAVSLDSLVFHST